MPYIGNKPADTTLVEDNSISTAKIVNDAVTKDKTDLITDSGGASLEAKGSSGYDGAIRLNCSVNSHFTELKSASHGSYSGNLSFTLPSSTGTNGQFLQTNGSGVLTFADAGALVSLGSADSTTNVPNVVFDNVFSDTYSRYIIYIDTFLNANDGESFYFKFRKSDGSGGYEDEARTGYTYNIRYIRSGNNEYSDSASSGGAQTFGRLSGGVKNSTGEHGLKAILNVYRPATRQSQATMTYVTCNGTYRSYSNDSTMAGILMSNCNNYHTDSMLGIKFYYSGGDVDDHKIRVYGVTT